MPVCDSTDDGMDDNFAWLPAWTLIADSRWGAAVRVAQRGADTAPERCAWQLLSLLQLERQGRQRELVDGRKALRTANPYLFDVYMRSRLHFGAAANRSACEPLVWIRKPPGCGA
jgi:hypothetical protein